MPWRFGDGRKPVSKISFGVKGVWSDYASEEAPDVNPDCGLKTRAWPETRASLENLVVAARTVRGELPTS